MKKNKEKALELAYDKVESYFGGVFSESALPYEHIEDIIELASKPDWYYPSRGEFPKLTTNERFLVTHIDSPTYVFEVIYIGPNKCYSDEEDEYYNFELIKAWAYLPKFEENER